MKEKLTEFSKTISNKNQPLLIAAMILFLCFTNLSFVASALPNVASVYTYNPNSSNFNSSNNTIGKNNSLNNIVVEKDRTGVPLQSSTENHSNGLQNTNILNYSNKNPRDDLDCYTEGLYVCNESGQCDNIKFDCLTECDDGITRTTGSCPNDDDRICWIEDEYICNDENGGSDNSSKGINNNDTYKISKNTTSLP
jgi:hypothetical protein